jgi:hypothetical protein
MLEDTTVIDTPGHDFKNIKEAKDWAKKNITGTYNNMCTGEYISVSRTAIDKYLSESAIKKSVSQSAHLSALKQIPKLIETSVLKETKQDRFNDSNIKEIRRFYGAINYENNIYPVKITVKVINQGGNKAYSYEVMQIESPIVQKELSGQSILGGFHEDRIHLTDGLEPNPDFPSNADFLPSADICQSVAEYRSPNLQNEQPEQYPAPSTLSDSGDKDTSFFLSPNNISFFLFF